MTLDIIPTEDAKLVDCESFERRSNTMAKADISKVIPSLARQALKLAGGDRKAAYSRYIQLYFRQTGRLVPGCDNKDLQAFYEKERDNDA